MFFVLEMKYQFNSFEERINLAKQLLQYRYVLFTKGGSVVVCFFDAWFLHDAVEDLVSGVVHHYLDELLEVYVWVLILVQTENDVFDLVLVDHCAQLGEHFSQISSANQTVVVFVKAIEHNLELFFSVVTWGKLLNDHAHELLKLNLVVFIEVKPLDHFLNSGHAGGLSESTHNLVNFLARDFFVVVDVENVENLLVIWNILTWEFQVDLLLSLSEVISEDLRSIFDIQRDFKYRLSFIMADVSTPVSFSHFIWVKMI